MNRPKISIIVPVHNAGGHLEKCLDSLVNQTLKDIEIILVLDCPTDGSDKVAEKYAENYAQITLLYNDENLHTGESRNRGMQVARGEYIGFFDHDDYCETTMYELLYNEAIKEDSDVVRCNYVCVYTNGESINNEYYKYPDFTSNLSDRKWVFDNVSGGKFSCVIWNHIYKSDFLLGKQIKFLDSRTLCSEDGVFFMEVYSQITKLSTIPDYLYYHVFHQTNTGKSIAYRSIQNRMAFFENIYQVLRANNIDEEEALSYLSQNVMTSLYSGARLTLIHLPLKQAFREIRQIGENDLIMKSIDRVYQKPNREELKRLKPTVRAFFAVIRVFRKKK